MAFVTDLGPLVYVNRILLGVGAGTLFTAYFTWASDMVPASRRTEGIALFGISGLVPLGLNAFAQDAGIAPPDLRWLFPSLAGVIVLSVVCLIPLREPKREPDPEGEEGAGLKGVLRALAERRLWPVWLATAVFAGLVGVFMAFATVTAQARGIGDPANLWLAYAVGAVGVRLIGARLPDRVGPSNLVAPALGLYLGAMLLASSATSGSGFVLAGLLAGLGHGYCFPVLLSQTVTRAPDRWRGSAMAMFTAIWGLAEFVLPPAFGAVSDSSGDAVMYLVATLCALVGLLAWCGLEHRLASSRPSDPTERRSTSPAPGHSGG
jgi:predicted MFS family arabinose efflux permease